MDQTWLYTPVILLLIFFFFFKKHNLLQTKNKHKNLPPSPPSLPIIGHLHLLKNPIVHRTFQQLSMQYGSIFSLNLGSLPFVVISSPAAVEECFTKNDIVLANRPQVLVGKHLHYEWTTIGAASYGPLWRNLRRLTTLELFATNSMNSFACIRIEEVRSLVKYLFGSSKEKFAKVEMSTNLSGMSLNILTRILTGKRYFFFGEEIGGDHKQEAEKFLDIMREVFELTGVSNVVDCFWFLRWINFRNVEGRMVAVKHKMDNFLDGLIEECRKRYKNAGGETAMIYNLLKLQDAEPANYPDHIIKGIIMVRLVIHYCTN